MHGPARPSYARTYIGERRCWGQVARYDWSTPPVNNSQGPGYIREERQIKGVARRGIGAEYPERNPSTRRPGRRGTRQTTKPLAGVTGTNKICNFVSVQLQRF